MAKTHLEHNPKSSPDSCSNSDQNEEIPVVLTEEERAGLWLAVTSGGYKAAERYMANIQSKK